MNMTRDEMRLRSRNQESLARALGGIGPDYDYSMIKKLDERNHGTDAGKLPWHPTFSDESEYSSPMRDIGGHWGKTIDGRTTYAPSQIMIDRGNTAGLAEYMQNVEPGVKLLPLRRR